MSMLRLATAIATKAHRGQFRKFGPKVPFISHPEAVRDRVEGKDAKTVGVLHDVPEDTDTTLDDLAQHFPKRIIDAIDCLTKRDGEPYMDFVGRAMTNNLARRVKIADVEHNMSTIPEGHGLIKKWEKALKVLKGAKDGY